MQRLKPELDTKRSVGRGPNGKNTRIKNSLSQNIRVNLGEVILSKSEYKIIRRMMVEWQASIGELCKYSLLSVIRAHNDSDGEEEEEI